MSLSLRLPWPPSVNHYWFAKGNRRYIGKAGKEFREQVVAEHGTTKPLKGKLKVHIAVIPPTNGRRDLDNLCKAPLDAMQHAGIYLDDGQIDDLQIVRLPKSPPGCLDVTISEIETLKG